MPSKGSSSLDSFESDPGAGSGIGSGNSLGTGGNGGSVKGGGGKPKSAAPARFSVK
jgi:hypothetical protein